MFRRSVCTHTRKMLKQQHATRGVVSSCVLLDDKHSQAVLYIYRAVHYYYTRY